jgi:hypothetical protein
VRLGNCAVEVVVAVVVFRGMVIGIEVTIVEPSELVVVRFPKEIDDVERVVVALLLPLLLLLLLLPEALLVVLAPVSESWAAEGVAAKARAEEMTMRERNRFILVRF